MTFFKRQDIGRIYVIKMVLPGNYVVHKIGITNSNRATDRMMEILRSWFTKFRFVPYSELRLDMECHNPEYLEQYIHRILRVNQFIPSEKVSGGTEMFVDLDENRVITFLKAYNNSSYIEPPDLTNEQYKIIGKLLTR